MKHVITLIAALGAIVWLGIAQQGCTSSSGEEVAESFMERPVDMAVVYERIPEEEYDELDANTKACFVPDELDSSLYVRPWGYVAQPSINAVAKVDLCHGIVFDYQWQSNPVVVSHIPVGLYPSDMAAKDKYVIVFNSQENTLSIIDSNIDMVVATLDILPEKASSMSIAGDGTLWFTLPESRALVAVRPRTEGDYTTLQAETTIPLPDAASASCKGRYSPEQTEDATIELDKDPLPGKVSDMFNDGSFLAVPNLTDRCFFILDVENQTFESFDIADPSTIAATSPDGRWLYIAKRWKSAVAVFDLTNEVYVDTNFDYPTHQGTPPAPDAVSYDIQTNGTPKGIAFGYYHKDHGIKRMPQEGEDGENDPDAVIYEEAESPAAHMFAFIATHKGILHTIDLFDELHEEFDAYEWDDPEKELPHLFSQKDPEVKAIRGGISDGNAKISEDGFEFARHRTPDADWQIIYNGVLPGSSKSVAGRFDFEAGRLYDPRIDFRRVPILLPSGRNMGDRLVITTPPLARCPINIAGDYAVSLEIIEVGYDENSNPTDPDFIAYNTNGLPDLSKCFDSSVEYEIRANENYIVFEKKSTDADYNFVGRAIPKLIEEGDKCNKSGVNDPWSFLSDEIAFMVCRIVEDKNTALRAPENGILPPPKLFQYTFTTVSEIDKQQIYGKNFVSVLADYWTDGAVYIVDGGGDSVIKYLPAESSSTRIW